MKFQEFCLKHATGNGLIDTTITDIPDRYKVPTESMVSMMKNKRDIFDRINVPFVEMGFEGDYEKTLEEKLPDGEVPDGIIKRLAEGIFGKMPSQLDDNQSAIIKVLSTYICIQN